MNIFGPGLKRFSFCPSNEFELKVRWKGCDLAEKKFYWFTMTVALARKKLRQKKKIVKSNNSISVCLHLQHIEIGVSVVITLVALLKKGPQFPQKFE